MQNHHATAVEKPLDINSPMALVAAIFINVVGPAVFIVQPGFIQLLVTYADYSAEQSGYVASAEMWGIAVTALLLTFFIGRFSWRTMLLGAIVLVVAGNLGSLLAANWVQFAVWRFGVGVGSGALISLGFTILGLTRNPDRNFGLAIAFILTYGAFGLWLVPKVGGTVGLQGVIVFFAVLALAVLPFIHYLPVSVERGELKPMATALPIVYRWMAVATMFFYFLGQGVVWTYLFLIGTQTGAEEQAVANGLTLSQFWGIAGAFLASGLGTRFGRIGPIAMGILGGMLSLVWLLGVDSILAYTLAVWIYNFAWNLLHPYLLAAMASFDGTGKVVTSAVSAQMMGLAIGPSLAAAVIDSGSFATVIGLGILFFALALGMILPPLIHQNSSLRREVPVPA